MHKAGLRIREILLRARWSAEDARIIFAAWEESKLPAADFAGKHGFDVQRLYWWRRRLGAPNEAAELEPFEELVVERDQLGAPEDGRSLEITLPRGLTIRVPTSFDEQTLRRLLKIVCEAGVC